MFPAVNCWGYYQWSLRDRNCPPGIACNKKSRSVGEGLGLDSALIGCSNPSRLDYTLFRGAYNRFSPHSSRFGAGYYPQMSQICADSGTQFVNLCTSASSADDSIPVDYFRLLNLMPVGQEIFLPGDFRAAVRRNLRPTPNSLNGNGLRRRFPSAPPARGGNARAIKCRRKSSAGNALVMFCIAISLQELTHNKNCAVVAIGSGG